MSDILDTLDEFDYDDADDIASAELDELDHDPDSDGGAALVDAAVDELVEFSETQARELTDAIRSAATATYILLSRAHEGKAYKALGYATWAEYIAEEFDMSTQRSYQLLDLSKVVQQIESVAPDGTEVRLTEAQARDIKKQLPEITERIAQETVDMEPDDAEYTISNIIDEVREEKKAESKLIAEKEQHLEDAERDGYQRGLEAAADAFLESNPPSNVSDDADSGFVEVDIEGERAGGGLSPSEATNLYNFVNALTGVNSLPEPEEFLATIPEDRRDDLSEQLQEAVSWMNRLSTLMELDDED